MKIKAHQIRAHLKQFDSPWPWGFKPSKTLNLFDPEYLLLEVDDFRAAVIDANTRIAERFNVTPGEVPFLWTKQRDCDKFAGWMVSFAQMLLGNPAIFRVIEQMQNGKHAYNMGLTKDGIYFADLTLGTDIWKSENPNIIGLG